MSGFGISLINYCKSKVSVPCKIEKTAWTCIKNPNISAETATVAPRNLFGNRCTAFHSERCLVWVAAQHTLIHSLFSYALGRGVSYRVPYGCGLLFWVSILVGTDLRSLTHTQAPYILIVMSGNAARAHFITYLKCFLRFYAVNLDGRGHFLTHRERTLQLEMQWHI